MIAERSAANQLTPAMAAQAVHRISSTYRGGPFERFPVLGNLWSSEEAASAMLGGTAIGMFTGAVKDVGRDRSGAQPGDAWMRVVRTRSRADALRMAEHMIAWVHGEYRREGGFGDVARSPENDRHIMDAITEAVQREMADYQALQTVPERQVATRLRPDMTLDELFGAHNAMRDCFAVLSEPRNGFHGLHHTINGAAHDAVALGARTMEDGHPLTIDGLTSAFRGVGAVRLVGEVGADYVQSASSDIQFYFDPPSQGVQKRS